MKYFMQSSHCAVGTTVSELTDEKMRLKQS